MEYKVLKTLRVWQDECNVMITAVGLINGVEQQQTYYYPHRNVRAVGLISCMNTDYEAMCEFGETHQIDADMYSLYQEVIHRIESEAIFHV